MARDSGDLTSPLKTGDVQKTIEERIFSGELPPGGKINEKALADELGISRAPVREALSALRHEGLVDMIPHRGAFVCDLSMKEVLDCYDVRGGLGHTAGKLLPQCISMLQLRELRHLQTGMEEMLRERDIQGYYRGNKEFHGLLFEAAGNRTLIAMNQAVERKLSLYLKKEMSNLGVLELSNREHLEILDLIAAGDAERTANSLEAHILKGKERLFQIS